MDPQQRADLQAQLAATSARVTPVLQSLATPQPLVPDAVTLPGEPMPKRRGFSGQAKRLFIQSLANAASVIPSPEGCGCAAGKARGLRESCMRMFGDAALCREALGERVWAMADDPRLSPIERGAGAVRRLVAGRS